MVIFLKSLAFWRNILKQSGGIDIVFRICFQIQWGVCMELHLTLECMDGTTCDLELITLQDGWWVHYILLLTFMFDNFHNKHI